MVIASIDLKGGKVVQLKEGRELVLERDDPEALIAEFDKYGEVAVIDLDGALKNDEDGKAGAETANSAILKRLLRRGNVRCGGGIRDVKRAKELVSLGAEKVIASSAAFTCGAGEGGVQYGLNAPFLKALNDAIGKERVIIAVDARQGRMMLNGWRVDSGLDAVECAKAAEGFCSEVLFTCVEREGGMSGIDMEAVKRLREAVRCRVVVAGGVSTVEEIAGLEKAGCDVQLGMALYTGKVSLAESFVACLNWQKGELIPVIAQSEEGEALMLGYANKEAFAASFASGRLTFWSRSRKSLWQKGETSGNVLQVIKMRADCDRDAVLATVRPSGPTCHTGAWSCFQSSGARPYSLNLLSEVIRERFKNPAPGSYTATLNDERAREKLMEEAEELTEAESRDDVIWECADLVYFLTVLMEREDVSWRDVLNELERRRLR